MSRLNDIELLSRNNKNKILLDDIASVISNRTGVPIYEIISNSGNIDDMKNRLKDIIVGEDKAIDNLMDITKRIRCGYNDRCYSLLFVGSSGVGKSRLAKEYANILVGADNLIRMDMSEYSDSTAINKILGSSPGYMDMMIIRIFWKKLEINLIVFYYLMKLIKLILMLLICFIRYLKRVRLRILKVEKLDLIMLLLL